MIVGGLLLVSGCVPSEGDRAIDAYNRGVDHLDMGESDEAIVQFTEAARLNPEDAEAYCNRGLVYLTIGEFDKVIADCNEAIRLDPTLAPAYCTRGGAYLQIGEDDKGIADCNEAIHLDPMLAMAYNNRGVAYLLNAGQKVQRLSGSFRRFESAALITLAR